MVEEDESLLVGAFNSPLCVFSRKAHTDPVCRLSVRAFVLQAATSIQAMVRGQRERQAFLATRRAANVVQMWVRGRLQRRWYLALIGQVRELVDWSAAMRACTAGRRIIRTCTAYPRPALFWRGGVAFVGRRFGGSINHSLTPKIMV